MSWPIVLQNIQSFVELRMIRPYRGILYYTAKIFDISNLQILVKTSGSNHSRIPILVQKVDTKFLLRKVQNNQQPINQRNTNATTVLCLHFCCQNTKKPHKRQLRKPVGMLTSHPSSLQDVYTIYITVSVYSCPRHYTY